MNDKLNLIWEAFKFKNILWLQLVSAIPDLFALLTNIHIKTPILSVPV